MEKAEVKVNIVCYDIKRNSSGECSDNGCTKNAFNASPKLTQSENKSGGYSPNQHKVN